MRGVFILRKKFFSFEMTSPLFRLYQPVLYQSLFSRLPNELLDKIWEEKLRLEHQVLHRQCMVELCGKLVVTEWGLREYILDGLDGNNESEEFWEVVDELWISNHRKPVECTVWRIDTMPQLVGNPLVTAFIRCRYTQDDGSTEAVILWSQYRWRNGKLISAWKLHYLGHENFHTDK